MITELSDTVDMRVSNPDCETPEQKRERILADSRKISMPIRPVGRPKKGASQAYKEAEAASRSRQKALTFAASYDNVFDLEEADKAQIEAEIVQVQYTSHNKRHSSNIQCQSSIQPRVVDTKGKISKGSTDVQLNYNIIFSYEKRRKNEQYKM